MSKKEKKAYLLSKGWKCRVEHQGSFGEGYNLFFLDNVTRYWYNAGNAYNIQKILERYRDWLGGK